MTSIISFERNPKAVMRKIRAIASVPSEVYFTDSFSNNNPDGIYASQVFFCLEQGSLEMDPAFYDEDDEAVCSLVAHVAGENIRVSLAVVEFSTDHPKIQILHAEEA